MDIRFVYRSVLGDTLWITVGADTLEPCDCLFDFLQEILFGSLVH